MMYEEVVELFVKEFPEYKQSLIEHIEFNGEILSHVFFGDEVNKDLLNLLEVNKDQKRLEKILQFLNRMALVGDDEVVNLLVVTILARIGDSPKALKNAYNYMHPLTREHSITYEKGIGRKRNLE